MALWGPMGGPKWPKTQNLAPWSSFLCILDHFGEFKFWSILRVNRPPLWCGAPDPPSGAGHQTPPLVRRTRSPLWCAAPDPPLDGHKFDPKVSEASGAHRVLVWGLKKLMRAYRPPSVRPQILTPNAVVQTPLWCPATDPPSGAPHQTPLCRPANFTQKSQRLPGPT